MKITEHTLLLLVLQAWTLLAIAEDTRYIDFDSLTSVGTVTFKGSSLRVFDIDGHQVAEPRISFRDTCDALGYSNLFLKYQLTLPISIDVNGLETPTDKSKRVGQVTLTELRVKADEALASSGAKVTIVTRLTKPGEAQLIFRCETFIRCQQLMEDIGTNPEELRSAISFTPVGRVSIGISGSGMDSPVKFGTTRSATLPKFSCDLNRWVVFQRRVDGSLSFAQNWDTYVRGFGNPESNYWMGLDQLFAMTVTSSKNGYALTSRCQLRVDIEDWSGKKYWGEYKMFEVLGPAQNYRLRLDQQVDGSQLGDFIRIHSETQFSTYDRDHDQNNADSCSQLFGFAGWWYGACHAVNLNGAYTTDTSIVDNPTYMSTYIGGKHLVMKSSIMKFKCV